MNLALQFRPQEFEDLIGQKEVKQVLQNQVNKKQIKQGYLFCGPAGTGKTTTARIIAKKVNNNKVSASSLIEIDGASNNGVDNIRNLIEDAKFKPMDSPFKVYIIDEAHMLSKGAFNALLKILEEPPKHVIFILATTEPNKIIPTILSRLQRFDFKPVNTKEITEHLEKICEQQNVKHDTKSLEYIAKISNGGVRDSILTMETCISYGDLEISKVRQVLGVVDSKLITNFVLASIENNTKVKLEIYSTIRGESYSLFDFVEQLSTFIVDLCAYTFSNKLYSLSQEDVTMFEEVEYSKLIEVRDSIMDFYNSNYYRTDVDKLFKAWCLE